MSEEPQTLAEALGVDPREISEQLRRDFDRIREAEHRAHTAASQVWLDDSSASPDQRSDTAATQERQTP